MKKLQIPGYSNLPTKTKQNINMGLGGLAVLALLMSAMAMVGGTEPEKKIVTPEAQKMTEVPGDAVTDKNLWFGGSGRKVTELEKRMDEMSVSQKDSNDAMQRKLELMFKDRFGEPGSEKGLTEATGTKGKEGADEGPVKVRDSVGEGQTKTAPGLRGQPKSDIPSPGSLTGYPPGNPNDTTMPGSVEQPKDSPVRERTIIRVPVTEKGAAASTTGEAKPKVGTTYLPIGHMRAVLLGGLDAPTGTQAASPGASVPVLLEVTDLAELPNGFRANVKRCFVVATGWGDVSSERAYLRTTAISCINRNGQTIESPLAGHIFGEDGKNGVRGRLQSKQGQILANALLSGVASGIGQAFSQQSTTVSVSPLGSTATPGTTPKDILNSSLGMGAGKAMDRLANYYIQLAEKTFPVIEVDAGRFVDIAIIQGTTLDAPLDLGNGEATMGKSIGRYVARDAKQASVALDANSAD